jgi:hypothetical protein
MREKQHQDRREHVGALIFQPIRHRRRTPRDLRARGIKLVLQLFDDFDQPLVLDDHRLGKPEIASALLADDRLVPDRLGTEWTFHRRFFLRVERVSRASLLRCSPDKTLGKRARLESRQLTLRFRDARMQLLDLALQFSIFFE